jgi:uncharacterized protein (DUF1684 family)
MSRIRERDLIEPVLNLIAKYATDIDGLDITKIDELLRSRMKLSDEDKEILKGRKDDKFSQVVRNLVSHRTLERQGLAEYINDGRHKRGAYFLTKKGAARASINNTLLQGDLFK